MTLILSAHLFVAQAETMPSELHLARHTMLGLGEYLMPAWKLKITGTRFEREARVSRGKKHREHEKKE